MWRWKGEKQIKAKSGNSLLAFSFFSCSEFQNHSLQEEHSLHTNEFNKKIKGRKKNDFFLRGCETKFEKGGNFDSIWFWFPGKAAKGTHSYNKEGLEVREAINGRARETEEVRIALKIEEWKVWEREKYKLVLVLWSLVCSILKSSMPSG